MGNHVIAIRCERLRAWGPLGRELKRRGDRSAIPGSVEFGKPFPKLKARTVTAAIKLAAWFSGNTGARWRTTSTLRFPSHVGAGRVSSSSRHWRETLSGESSGTSARQLETAGVEVTRFKESW